MTISLLGGGLGDSEQSIPAVVIQTCSSRAHGHLFGQKVLDLSIVLGLRTEQRIVSFYCNNRPQFPVPPF